MMASFGPACWISSRIRTGATAVSFAYHPVVDNCPRISLPTIERYARLLAADGWCWMHGMGVADDDGRFVLLLPTEWSDESDSMVLRRR